VDFILLEYDTVSMGYWFLKQTIVKLWHYIQTVFTPYTIINVRVQYKVQKELEVYSYN